MRAGLQAGIAGGKTLQKARSAKLIQLEGVAAQIFSSANIPQQADHRANLVLHSFHLPVLLISGLLKLNFGCTIVKKTLKKALMEVKAGPGKDPSSVLKASFSNNSAADRMQFWQCRLLVDRSGWMAGATTFTLLQRTFLISCPVVSLRCTATPSLPQTQP